MSDLEPDEAPELELESEEASEPDLAEKNLGVLRQMRHMSRRSFIWAGIAAIGAYKGITWLASRKPDGGTAWPFRRVLDSDGDFAEDYFRPDHLAPTFPVSAITDARENGDVGIDDADYDTSQWKLTVNNVFGKDGPIELTMEDIKKLPEVTQITELYCIEGWSIKVKWTGVRFLDFAKKYPPNPAQGENPDVAKLPENLVRYVGMLTPDEAYYVGLDMASALHPQTLLCYAMNGEPLTLEHGAPLRLAIPVKYGIKNIKRIGTITYTDEKPKDYWAEQGYDWFAGM